MIPRGSNNNPLCDCGRETILFHSSETIYGRNFGPLYVCQPCGTRVGCHKGTLEPLGTPANEHLRKLRSKAHSVFDPLWNSIWEALKVEKRMETNKEPHPFYGKSQARKTAYQWLADELKINIEDCHISHFDIDTCNKVIKICSQFN